MSAADLGEVNEAELKATYERGFSLLKSATERESRRDYAGAQKLYVDGCEVFMQLKEVEKDPKKRETIRKNLSHIISAAERVSKKLNAADPETETPGEIGVTAGEGEKHMEIIRPGSKSTKQYVVEGVPHRGHAINDAEMGEGIPFDDPVIELAARKNSKAKFAVILFIILALITVIILVVVLCGSNNSSTNEGSYTMETGWRFEIEAEISGFDPGHSMSVEDQVVPSKVIVEDELGLDSGETLLMEIEEISEGVYQVVYFVLSQIDGNVESYKAHIQDNTESIEEAILQAIFGSSATDDQTISIDNTEGGLVIVELTHSPTFRPTLAPTQPTWTPTYKPSTNGPTMAPTSSPTIFPTQGPTAVGPVDRTITWFTSMCCLLESQIESTVSSIASVLSVSDDRIHVESYTTMATRRQEATPATWNIIYKIYTYTTDDQNFHTEIINSLKSDSVVNDIEAHITDNTEANIDHIETLTLSADNDAGSGIVAILMTVLYAVAGVIAVVIFCYCACKCRNCNKK